MVDKSGVNPGVNLERLRFEESQAAAYFIGLVRKLDTKGRWRHADLEEVEEALMEWMMRRKAREEGEGAEP